MASFPLWAAIRTIKSKIGTWVGYERYTEIDDSVTREEWARHIGLARAALAGQVGEITRPLNRRPVESAGEVRALPSRVATGFLQTVTIYVRDAQTGVITERPWAIRTDTLMSRQSVVTQALSRFEAAVLPEGTFEGEEVLDASYDGTFRYTPE